VRLKPLFLAASWAQLDKITGPLLELDPDGTATTSKIAREDQQRQFFGTPDYETLKAGEEKDRFEYESHKRRIEDDLRRREDSQATSRVETGQLPSDLDNMRAYSDLPEKAGVTGITRYGSGDSSELSPLPTTIYWRSIQLSLRARFCRIPLQLPG